MKPHCVWINTITRHPRWDFGEHIHEGFHEIYLTLRGGIQVEVAGRKSAGRRGDILFHPRAVPHMPAICSGDIHCIRIRWEGCDGLCAEWDAGPVFDQNGRVRYLLEWILDLHPPRDDYQATLTDSLTESMLHEVSHLRHSPQSALATRARRYVREHLAEAITLEQLAADACLSKYHYARTFRDSTGITPLRFVLELRIQAARHLIRTSSMTMERIAAETGLSSASYLAYVFRKYEGCSPSSLRFHRRLH